ncbi:MAG: hypothetical protein ACUVQ9_13270 [Thermodesulfobacteriota bacterium]
MISIGIKYVINEKDKNGEGIILAGDTAAPCPTADVLITERFPFIRLGEFPVVFAPNALQNSAIISDFVIRLAAFLEEKFKEPSNFSVNDFMEHYHDLHILFNKMANYYSDTQTSKSERTSFDFILAGSDKNGETMLYYGDITDKLTMEDIGHTTCYITTKMGQAEGMAFLSLILKTNEIPKDVAEETAVSILEMLSKIKSEMSKNFELYCLEDGEVLHMKKELLKMMRGFVDYRWNASWLALKNSLKDPRYVDYLLNRYWRSK